ncbi:MAG: polysaccharide biosynthesis/export family protein, partial [FCB group bacterium]
MKKALLWQIVLFFFVLIDFGYAQKGISPFESQGILKDDILDKADLEKLQKTDMMPIGNVIISEYYKVGPGDILSYLNLTVNGYQQFLTITPENTVIVPRIGVVDINNKTLSQVRDTIINLINQRNPNATSYITLYQPRTVIISLSGNTLFPGTKTFPASYRVSTAIKASNHLSSTNNSSAEGNAFIKYQEKRNETEKVYSNSGMSSLLPYSSRNIRLYHADGTSENVDI